MTDTPVRILQAKHDVEHYAESDKMRIDRGRHGWAIA
jgi:hypothetical protein